MNLAKVLNRITGKEYEYDPDLDMTMNKNGTIGLFLSDTPITHGWKDNHTPKGIEEKATITWAYSKYALMEALELLRGNIKIIQGDNECPIILMDDTFQVRIAPLVELNETEEAEI